MKVLKKESSIFLHSVKLLLHILASGNALRQKWAIEAVLLIGTREFFNNSIVQF